MACVRTFATLRVFSPSMTAEEVTCVLGIEPSRTIRRDLGSRYEHVRRFSHWRWSTEGKVSHLEPEVHIAAISALLRGKTDSLDALRKHGCILDVFCYWEFSEQGAISLSLDSMRLLLELGLEITWDVYAQEVAERERPEETAFPVGGV